MADSDIQLEQSSSETSSSSIDEPQPPPKPKAKVTKKPHKVPEVIDESTEEPDISSKIKKIAKFVKPPKKAVASTVVQKKQTGKHPINFFKSPWQVFKEDWRALLAEFFATMMFVFMGTGLLVSYNKDKRDGGDLGAGLVSISFGFGTALSTMIYTVANLSGGHLNPAVTIALLAIKQIELFKAIGYVGCQMAGGIIGTALMYGVMPDEITEFTRMGATLLAPNVSPGEGCALEICLTFILVFTVCATAELSGGLTSMGRFAPLVIGYSVLVDHMIGVPFTGASMNPARSFGPAVVSGHFENHWVYWVGPIVGGLFASMSYHHLFLTTYEFEKKPRNK